MVVSWSLAHEYALVKVIGLNILTDIYSESIRLDQKKKN